ncbi:thiosulfate sulfurtransferase/rhodanese-like domain-containing protein 3 [Rhineura floridana]|uniref:thiosulfate sulfurtransferase/rhodanese-like domain-containing protein 3 n=1 Tax=Rhineura floridana TaxID=261503 RepID=UPI002AC8113F|nr:thiosulfate sulfurtransferase/rhodanese-like domain-containing protein 3 [Rhineura floridana]
MWGWGCRLGRAAFVLITQRTAVTASGGRRGSQLAQSHHGGFLLRLESAAGNCPFRNSNCLKPERPKVIVCHFCTAKDQVSFKELKEMLESNAILLIDVREKWETEQYGKIRGSINIPLGEVVEALQMDPVHFKEIYNQDMPSKSDNLVFSCMAGVRSIQALAAAKSLGFSRAQHFAGGFKEWTEYESSRKK